MSHLNLSLANNINSALRVDSTDTGSGPVARWQRKARERGLTIKSSSSLENSFANRSGLCITPSSKTPLSSSLMCGDMSMGAPSSAKSPARAVIENIKKGKSPHRSLNLSIRNKTPTRNTPNTPNILGDKPYQGDRFIPRRPTEQESDLAHHLVMKHLRQQEGTEPIEELTQQQKDYRDKMTENLNNGQPLDTRISHFSTKTPSDSVYNSKKILCSATKESAKKKATRHIPNVPERVLDAPEMRDDYYLHLIDWSKNNHIVVALAGTVYIWNATDGNISSLSSVEPPDYICSLAWIKDGNVLAVGQSSGIIELWDANENKLIRTMGGHESRVSTVRWSDSILTSGSRTGQIIHSDVRIAEHVTGVINAHNQEVCGLAYSSDGRYLGSGGNDNVVKIFDKRSTTHLHRLTAHEAAVKAVAWCPWQNNILATGGGTNDKTIRLWNANSGVCTKEVPTDSQVSSIVFNSSYKELISGHGYSNHQLILWRYPNFNKVTELTGHTGRVLDIVSSPDGEMIASAAGDETIRLWKVWPTIEKKIKKPLTLEPVSSLNFQIR